MNKKNSDNYSSLIGFIRSYIAIDSNLEEELRDRFKLRYFKKKDLLLKPGQECLSLYFLCEGAVRTYYFHDIKEISSWFYLEPYFFSSWASFLKQKAGSEYIEVLEDSVILEISYDSLHELYREEPEMSRFGRLLVEEQLAGIEDVYKGFLFLSAREKYDLLLEYFPNITEKVNLGHIASFLGISQETLSRIRDKRS